MFMFTSSNKRIFIVGISLIIAIFLIGFVITRTQKRDVIISTNTPGVTYKISGETEGKTPAKIKLKPGKYKIELSKEGRKTINETFTVSSLNSRGASLHYNLEVLSGYIFPKAGNMDVEKAKESLKKFQEQFPYEKDLPHEGGTFYIDTPFDNGKINVYINKYAQAKAKEEVYKWFSDHGVKDPKSLKITWITK